MSVCHEQIRQLQQLLKEQPQVEVAVLFHSNLKLSSEGLEHLQLGIAGSHAFSPEQKASILESIASLFQEEVALVDLQLAGGKLLQQALHGQVIQNQSPRILSELFKRMWEEEEVQEHREPLLKNHINRFLYG